jgi:ElaB/YqjD/DUF883 family membrane-anchored ribosome-binding protein
MGRVAKPQIDTAARERRLVAEIKALNKDIKAMVEAESWTASVQGRALKARLATELDELRQRKADAAAKQGSRDPASMTPAEWAALIEQDARMASEEDLEVYLGELIRRRQWVACHNSDGSVTFAKRSSQAAG